MVSARADLIELGIPENKIRWIKTEYIKAPENYLMSVPTEKYRG